MQNVVRLVKIVLTIQRYSLQAARKVMNLWRLSNRCGKLEVIAIAVMLLTGASLMHLFALPPQNTVEQTLPEETSEENEYVETTGQSNEKHNDVKQEEKLIFQAVQEVYIPTAHDVVIRGLQRLPENFLRASSTEREPFRYRMQPSRIIGENGVLAIREFQGNSWTGTLMKGAIVFFVQSSATHYRRRQLHRATWAAIRDIDGWKIEVIFVVGFKPADTDLQMNLVRENRKYGDLLQYCGSDLFNSTTDKLLAGLQWAVTKLPDDFYFASTTDDMLVNVATVRDIIAAQAVHFPPPGQVFTMTAKDGSTVTSSLPLKVYCFEKYSESEAPERNLEFSRSVSSQVYNAEQWPPYCGEGLYTLPITFARELYFQSQAFDGEFPPELHDVLVTGILRRKTNRGDENIAKMTADFTGREAVLRSDVLPRSNRAKLAKFELDAEEGLKKVWKDWYATIRYRFHILTPL